MPRFNTPHGKINNVMPCPDCGIIMKIAHNRKRCPACGDKHREAKINGWI